LDSLVELFHQIDYQPFFKAFHLWLVKAFHTFFDYWTGSSMSMSKSGIEFKKDSAAVIKRG
jgi:hypothetical protein